MGVTLALVGGELVGLAAVLFATRGLASAVPTFDSPRWRMLLAASLPLGAAAILVAIVNRFDFQMLQWMLPASIRDVEIGYYGAAYRVPQLVERLPLLVMATIFPIMSQLSVASPIRLQQLYHQTLRNFALIAAPMVAIVTWQAPMMLRLLCGPGYEPAVPMLRLLVWSSAFVYVAVVAGNLLIAIGHQGASLRAWVIAAPINIGLNLMLIPRYGARGAAASTSVSFLIVLLIVLVLAERRLKDTIIGQTPVSIVPAGEPSRVR
jgi:O-antigen/teichoic acid export membrane protein